MLWMAIANSDQEEQCQEEYIYAFFYISDSL